MTTFDDRERAEEARYALDQQTQFRVTARRNKLLGMWAAGLLGLEGADAEAYAKSVVLADLEEAGDGDVIRKVRGDLEKAGIVRTDSDITEELARLLPVARQQVISDQKS